MLMNGTISSIHNNPTRIVEGTLLLGKSGALDPAHNMRLDGGTLALAAGTENSGASLTVTKDSTLDFGDGAKLALAGLSIADNVTLTLAGNVPKKGFKVSATLDAATISRIEFADGRNGYVLQNSDGYIRTANGLHITIY